MTDEEKRAKEEKFWKQKEEDIAKWKNREYSWIDYERAIADNITPFTIYMKIAEDAAELSKIAAMVARKNIAGRGQQIGIHNESYNDLRRKYLTAEMKLSQSIRLMYTVRDRDFGAFNIDIYDLVKEVEYDDVCLERAKRWVDDIDRDSDDYTRGRIYQWMYDWREMLDSVKEEKEDSDGT